MKYPEYNLYLLTQLKRLNPYILGYMRERECEISDPFPAVKGQYLNIDFLWEPIREDKTCDWNDVSSQKASIHTYTERKTSTYLYIYTGGNITE